MTPTLKELTVVIATHNAWVHPDVLASAEALQAKAILIVSSNEQNKKLELEGPYKVERVDDLIMPGKARNIGALAARSKYVLFLDNDVSLTESGLEAVRTYCAEQREEFYGGVYEINFDTTPFSAIQDAMVRFRNMVCQKGKPGGLSGSHFIGPKEAYLNMGGFHELMIAQEDLEFSSRARLLGHETKIDAAFGAIHHKVYSLSGILKDYFLKALHSSYMRLFARRTMKGTVNVTPGVLFGWLMAFPAFALLLAAPWLYAQPWYFIALAACWLGATPFSFHAFAKRELKPMHRAWCLPLMPCIGLCIVLGTGLGYAYFAWWQVRRLVVKASDMLRILARVLFQYGMPIQIIYFVTAICNLRCSHCFYKETLDKPDRGEVPLDIFHKTTKSIGPVLWFSLAGGEPYLRKDLTAVVEKVLKNNRPHLLSFPTNGWYTQTTLFETMQMLLRIQMWPTKFLLYFSLDGPKAVHDEIRRKESFDKVLATMKGLKPFEAIFPNFHVNAITTVTPQNAPMAQAFVREVMDDMQASALSINLFRYHKLGADPLPPELIDAYEDALDTYREYMNNGKALSFGWFTERVLKIKELLQKDLILKVARGNEFVTPCTAGNLSYVIEEDGRIKACEILPDDIGNVYDEDKSFSQIARSGAEARKLRGWIKDTKCRCTYECANSTNALFSRPMTVKLVKKFFTPGPIRESTKAK